MRIEGILGSLLAASASLLSSISSVASQPQHPAQGARGESFIECLGNPVQRKPKIAQNKNAMEAWQLAGGVKAIARFGIDVGRLQQAHFVVMTQRADRNLGEAGELSDFQHEMVVKPLATGESSTV